jgi:hypothetical protein
MQTPLVMPSIEEATIFARLFVEHVGEMHGHDLLPWTYDEHGVAHSKCQICGRPAQIFYRATREPRYAHRLEEPCPGPQGRRGIRAG